MSRETNFLITRSTDKKKLKVVFPDGRIYNITESKLGKQLVIFICNAIIRHDKSHVIIKIKPSSHDSKFLQNAER